MSSRSLLALVILLSLVAIATGQRYSKWTATFNESQAADFIVFPNSMLTDSYVTVIIVCTAPDPTTTITVSWTLEEVDCFNEMLRQKTIVQKGAGVSDIFTIMSYDHLNNNASNKFIQFNHFLGPRPIVRRNFQTSQSQTFLCGEAHMIRLLDESSAAYMTGAMEFGQKTGNATWNVVNQRRDTDTIKDRVTTVWEDGLYHFMLNIQGRTPPTGEESVPSFTAKAFVEMRSVHGFLPAIVWPLLPARGVMAFLYLCVGTAWVLLWARSHQHTLRIHIAIGGVAVAGALANTLSFVDLTQLNSNGRGTLGVLWVAQFLDAVQGGLTLLLLMVVSTGYGITRPTLQRRLLFPAIGCVVVETFLRLTYVIVMDESMQLYQSYPVLLLGVGISFGLIYLVIGGWIMVFAIMTFVHLCRRKHSEKIIVFSVFTGSCALAFIVLVIVTGLSIYSLTNCSHKLMDWRHRWVFQCFWDVQCLVLLGVLMWLWRPADEAQSYAFRPLSNNEEDELLEADASEEISTDKMALEMLMKT